MLLASMPWLFCYGAVLLALLTLGQLTFQRTNPILCIYTQDVLADATVAQQSARAWWSSLLWIAPLHCVLTGLALHCGAKLLPRSTWVMGLQTNIFIHVIILHTLSRITAMPWSDPLTFTWSTQGVPQATCILANPFRFLFPSFPLIAFQVLALLAVV
jgi:hypothetical protein